MNMNKIETFKKQDKGDETPDLKNPKKKEVTTPDIPKRSFYLHRSEKITLDKDVFTLGIWMQKRNMFDQKPRLFKLWVAICITIIGL